MRIDWRAAALVVAAVTALGTVLGISFVRASGGSAPTRYEVTVQFNTAVTQDDINEAGALLRTFDDDVEFLIMELFPPIGRAILATDAPDFCRTVATELRSGSHVDGVSCRPWQEPAQMDTAAPVTNESAIESNGTR